MPKVPIHCRLYSQNGVTRCSYGLQRYKGLLV